VRFGIQSPPKQEEKKVDPLATSWMDIAVADATRLGHKMSTWSGPMEDGRMFAYCYKCDDYMDGWPKRRFGKAQVTGPVLVMRCCK
jgi:hypothetical protein